MVCVFTACYFINRLQRHRTFVPRLVDLQVITDTLKTGSPMYLQFIGKSKFYINFNNPNILLHIYNSDLSLSLLPIYISNN